MDIINVAKMLLKNNFDMKDLGEANVILGMKISRTSNGIFVDQSHYIEKILKKYNYFDCKPASIISNNTWKLVDLPPGCKTIGCKWVLRRKLKPDGFIEKFKARLVAKGFFFFLNIK